MKEVMEVAPTSMLEGSKLSEQISSETESIQRGVVRYRKLAREATERGDGASLKPAERMIIHWLEPLKMAIREEQKACVEGKPSLGRAIYGNAIWCLDADRIAVITAHEMISWCMQKPLNGVLLVRLAYAIGNGVVAEINADNLRTDNRASYEELDKRFKRLTHSRVNAWAKKTMADPMWSRRVCVHLGTKLVKLAMGVASIKNYDQEGWQWKPAFAHEFKWMDGHKKGVIRLTSEALGLIEEGHLFRQHLRPRFAPMLIPPYLWKEGEPGGYVQVRTPFVSKPTVEQTEAIENTDMSLVYESLNAINSTPWDINCPILNIMKTLWDDGGGTKSLPKADLQPLPPKPVDIDTNEEARKAWKKEAHDVHGENAKLRGARVEFMQKISIADNLKKEKEIYFPHQLCFRARAYPIPIILNHHGDDVARSLMLFSNKVELTDRGRWWQRVHAANMYGYDKADFESRVSFITNMMPQIEACISRPLDHMDFWDQADEPMQFLAACMGMLDDNIGSRLPIQIDGSCNGLQHFCAAGRDERGGTLVNLVPGPNPQDAYIEVLNVVKAKLEKQDTEIARQCLKHLTRKVLKQPVMTQVYNVTRVGARDQVKEQLKKLGVKKEDQFPISKHLSDLVMESVGDVFPEAIVIMRWIEECCRMMCKDKPMRSIQWKNPVGFPVIQPYRNMRKFQIKTVMQRLTVGERDQTAPVMLSKQVQGGPPNVVHSWDGAHMMLTSIDCADHEIDFAAVHDSYWSHASNIDDLSDILRTQFVEMHKEDLVGKLYLEWQEAYPDIDLPVPPAKGSLDLDQVMDSPYFFG